MKQFPAAIERPIYNAASFARCLRASGRMARALKRARLSAPNATTSRATDPLENAKGWRSSELKRSACDPRHPLTATCTSETIKIGIAAPLSILTRCDRMARKVRESAERLRSWGVHVIDPHAEGEALGLAPTDALVKAVQQRLG